MNIDATPARILVARFTALQPENPGDDWIASPRIDRNNFARETSMLENCSLWEILSQFSAHPKPPDRGFVAAELITKPEL
jgi:hypothetical protein